MKIMTKYTYLLFLILGILSSCELSNKDKKKMEKRMVEIADSVYNSKINAPNIENSETSKNKGDLNPFIGRWCESTPNDGITLDIAADGASYNSMGGPFRTVLKFDLKGDVIYLIYKECQATFPINDKACEGKTIAKCYLKGADKLILEVMIDNCGQMAKGKYFLNRVKSI